tara:strand:- start:76731 stop:78416 length:1686 start_codon:yes stop_codon:yes gene_type:complete
MKINNLKQVKVLFILTLLSINGYCQKSEKSKSKAYTIGYSSIESGNVEIYQKNAEGKSTIKSTNKKGGYLAWSPDGKQFAFYHKYDEKKTWSIHTMNSDGTNRKRLTHKKNMWDNSPTWSPDGKKIVFSRAYKDADKNWQKELWIMNSDGSEQAQIKSLNGGGPYFTSDNRILFHSVFKDKKNEISIADIHGKNIVHLTDNDAEDWHPEVSPNGKQIAFMSDRDGNHEIYVMNIDGSNQKRLTNNDFDDWYPSWSPDGSQIIFSSLRNEEKSIYMMNKDGSSVRKIIANATSPAWLKIHQSEVLEGPYIGQKPPGSVPEIFAPRGLSTEHRDGSGFFTPNMKEFYFTRRSFKDGKWLLVVFKSENNRWRESVIGPRIGRPIITPDGKTMLLGKHYMERTETGWSEVKSLGPIFDREDWGIMRLSASANGTYVFDDAKNNDVIRISTIKNGKREEPKLLGKEINTGKWTAHPFIAPDESYLIWDSEREGGYGDSDLYISFRQKDGSWGSAINLGDTINTSASEGGAYITPDGKYLFFNRYISEGNAGMYWVDAQVIETLRPQ